MTPEEIRRIVQRAIDGMTCWCYRPDLMETIDEKCCYCELRELAAELERQAAA